MFIPKGWHCFAVAYVFINFGYYRKKQQQTTAAQSRYFLIYILFLTEIMISSLFSKFARLVIFT